MAEFLNAPSLKDFRTFFPEEMARCAAKFEKREFLVMAEQGGRLADAMAFVVRGGSGSS